MQDKSPKDVIIAINDNAQDGIDISVALGRGF